MPKQDYLSVIRETEEKAEAMVAMAHAESRLALDEAHAEAARRIEAARTEAEALQQQMLQDTARRSEAQSLEQIAKAATEVQQIRTSAEPAMAEAVRVVAGRIVS